MLKATMSMTLLAFILLATTTVECARAVPGNNAGGIAFVSDRRSETQGALHIYRMNADGRGPTTRLTKLPGDNVMPAWSPDGARIAFVHSDAFGIPGLYTMGADGSDETPLTSDLLFNTEPAWFPGGRKIVLSRSEDIYAMTLDAGGAQAGQLSRLTRDTGADRHPAVSPDGKKIAFASDRDGDFDIYVMKAAPESAGNRPVKLTRNTASDFAPDWSPDGKKIAFSTGPGGAREVYVMKAVPQDVDTNRPANLTENTADDSEPAWSPDGGAIAFVSDRTGDEEVWRMAADGADPTNLTKSPNSREIQPAWQPAP